MKRSETGREVDWGVIEPMVARDGFEPPPPAFSEPLVDNAKPFGINRYD
jgi:hypothetical protein